MSGRAVLHGGPGWLAAAPSRLQRCPAERAAPPNPVPAWAPRLPQRCQDKAQELLPSQPAERDVERAQAALASCAADCAVEYEKQIPRLQKEIVGRLKQMK